MSRPCGPRRCTGPFGPSKVGGKNGFLLREGGFIDMHNIYPWQGVYISENDSRGKKLKGKKKRGKKGKKGKGAKIKGKRGRGKKKRKKGRGEEKMGQKGGKNKGW